jgi:murein DD-endopeptidase MepM/ murein hydrolase activator NlpD
MQKIIFSWIKKNTEIFALSLLIVLVVLTTSYYNHSKKITEKNVDSLLNNVYLEKTLKHIFNKLEPKYKKIEHKVRSGETLRRILERYAVSNKEINIITNRLSKSIDLSKINKNQIIQITIDQDQENVSELIYPISRTKKITLTKNLKTKIFDQKIIVTELTKKIVYKENVILRSLYKSAIDENIPPNVIVEFARLYGFQIDFQRDIRKKDTFQLMYEVFLDDEKNVMEIGEILFANLRLSGNDHLLYYYNERSNKGHYDENGKSIQKTLMKTPINGARLSSPFGMRKHPIDGFNKMHQGTDFAAPLGTPIMASGDGVVVKVGWCGGGGNCIKIKHNSVYQTIYAHMSKFASNIKSGTRVKQAQIIGFVGSTGKSTGPHLHYEVIENGKKINSQTLKLPSGKVLKGQQRKFFETEKIKLNVLKSEKIMGLN